MTFRDFKQTGERGDIAVHAEDGIGNDDFRPTLIRRCIEHGVECFGVGVRIDADLSTR